MKHLRLFIAFLICVLSLTVVEARRVSRNSTSHSSSRSSHKVAPRPSRSRHVASKRPSRRRSIAAARPDTVQHPFLISYEDYEEMLELCDTLGLDDTEAQYMLGNYFFQQMVPGFVPDSSYCNAAFFWDIARRGRHPRAIANLAYCYRNGLGVEVDTARACDLYVESLALGNEQLADMLRRSAFSGSPIDAWILYSYHSEYKQGSDEQADSVANVYLRLLSEFGDEEATRMLGDYYYEHQMMDSALFYYSFLEEPTAEVDYLISEMTLGRDADALATVRANAEQGNQRAVDVMAEVALTGNYNGRPVEALSDAEAVKWTRKSAALGSHNAGMAMAHRHVMGEGVEQNFERAIYFLENSLPGGHTRDYLNQLFTKWYVTRFQDYITAVSLAYDGQNELARKYFNSIKQSASGPSAVDARLAALDLADGIDPAVVFKHLAEITWSNPAKPQKRKLLKNASPEVLTMLAGMMWRGEGTTASADAERWACEAASRGDAEAMSMVGDMAFARGDYAAAVAQYRDALDKTAILYPAARRNYIKCLQEGLGVAADSAMAETLTHAVPSNLIVNLYLVTLNAVNPQPLNR